MEINIWQILFQALNFGAILFVLNKFLYKPIINVLETRQAKINEGLAAADKNLKAAEETEKLKKAELTKARKEASEIIKNAEKEAKEKATAIIGESREKARQEAERILASAKAQEVQAMKKIDQRAAELAVLMAKKALAKTLTDKEVEAITTRLVTELG